MRCVSRARIDGSPKPAASGIMAAMINLFVAAILLAGAQDTTLALIPRPAHITRGTGAFTLTANTAIVTDRATRDVGYQLAEWVEPAAGFRFSVFGGAGAATHTISLGLDSSLSRLGDEGYRLTVTPAHISIRAYKPAGVFYGVETLRQLLPPDVFRSAPVAGVAWAAPARASCCRPTPSARRRSRPSRGRRPPSRSKTCRASPGAARISTCRAPSCRRSSSRNTSISSRSIN